MLCETVYPYGTTIRVWYRKTYHTRMVRTVRVRYVPYAYGMKYAYGTQHTHMGRPCAYGTTFLSHISILFACITYFFTGLWLLLDITVPINPL